MSNGGLSILVSTGVADFPLTGLPEITFWKAAHRRHSNFATETQEQTNVVGHVEIQKNADLLYWMTLVTDVPALLPSGDCDDVRLENMFGYARVGKMDVKVGGQCFEECFGDLWAAEDEVDKPDEKYMGEIVGARETELQLIEDARTGKRYYTPLRPYFSRNNGDAFPLVSLQFSQLNLDFRFRQMSELVKQIGGSSSGMPINVETSATLKENDVTSSLYLEYVFLEEDERLRFAQWPQEYLITQTRAANPVTVSGGQTSLTMNLDFSHPVKQIFLVARLESNLSGANRYNFSGQDGVEPIVSLQLKINGGSTQQAFEGQWFRVMVPYYTNRRVPKRDLYIYAFNLDYGRKNPTGQLNFSRTDNAQFVITLAPTSGGDYFVIDAWARNFNIVRFHGGSAGVLFA